jgi:hypothetical protein
VPSVPSVPSARPGLRIIVIAALTFTPLPAQDQAARRVTWGDTAPLRARLEAASGLTAAGFPAYVERVHRENERRVREGDLDHLIFYALQSTRFTSLPSIEPALSAKSFVEGLDAAARAEFLQKGTAPVSKIPAPARARLTAFVRALDSSNRDERLEYFRGFVKASVSSAEERESMLQREYLRAMKFVYEKEFVAQTSERRVEAIADLYRSRGLSTDTAVEAGYVVYLGLGVLKSLDPDRRVRRVLIVGPGLDLAPRTGLVEAGPPESYQPWAVIDALLALGLSRTDDLEVVAADINPRVVEHLRRASTTPPSLPLVSEIRATDAVALSAEYRDYFAGLGRAAGDPDARPTLTARKGHLAKTVRVKRDVARTLRSASLDIVTERLDAPPFDLVIATNILPYFDDVQLMLALTNIASMVAPGGTFLHNEPRPVLGDITQSLGLRFEQSRHAIIATVRGAPAPLGDSVFLHRR